MRLLSFVAIACLIAAGAAPLLGAGVPVGTSIVLSARADYDSGVGQPDFSEASTTLTVMAKAGAAVERDAPVEPLVAGTDNYVPLHITNTGNGPDSYQLSVLSEAGWEVALVRDDNADGVHQPEEDDVIDETGEMVADGYVPCFARVTAPAGAVVGDVIFVTVVSNLDPAGCTVEEHFALGAPEKLLTSLSLVAAPNPLYVGQEVVLSGVLSPAMAGRLTMTITSPGGGVSSFPVDTAANGAFACTRSTVEPGEHTIGVAFAGDDCYAGSFATCSLQVNPRVHTSLTASVSPAQPTVGDTITVSGSITPAAQVALALECTGPSGAVTRADVTTDAAGHYNWQVGADETGLWSVSISYAGSVSHEPADASVAFNVMVPHELTFTAGPLVNPATVESGGVTTCSATATDARGHGVAYAWSDGGAGGAFAPSAGTRNPTYTAPANGTGADIEVSLTCAASCADPGGVGRSATIKLTVHSVPLPTCTVTAPAGPTSDDPIVFAIAFSEPVTGLGATSIVVSGGTKGGLLGAGAAYTISVTPTGDGAVTCRVLAGAAQGAAGCLNLVSNTASVTYDGTAPAIEISSPTADPTCVRVGSSLRLAGVSAGDTSVVAWTNETTGDSGQCVGSTAWWAEGIPIDLGVNLIGVTSTDHAGNVGEAEITVTRIDVDAEQFHDAWRGVSIVSLPIVPDTSDPAQVVSFSGNHWCRFSSLAGRYFYYPEASTWLDPLESTPGRGFAAEFSGVPDVPCGTVPPQDQPRTVHLLPGWNLVGQPFLSTIAWDLDTITVRDGISVTTLGGSDLVGHRAFGWQQSDSNPLTGDYYPICDPTDDPTASSTMPPWRAYWILALKACDLIIPAPGVVVEQSSLRPGRSHSVQPADMGFATDLPPPPG